MMIGNNHLTIGTTYLLKNSLYLSEFFGIHYILKICLAYYSSVDK